jgi:hypothetical protein
MPSERSRSASVADVTPSQVAPAASAARATGAIPCPNASAFTTAITSAAVALRITPTLWAIASRSTTAADSSPVMARYSSEPAVSAPRALSLTPH